MQLKQTKSIRGALTTATVAFLSATVVQAATGNHSETSVLFYSERDRVRATEVIYDLSKLLKNNYSLGLRLTYDGLTGASPTGGSPSKQAQTLTRASGGERTVVPAGTLPIDQSFSETRFALDASLAKTMLSGMSLSGEFHGSTEHDYKSLSVGAGISQEFNDGNTTLGFLGAVGRDVIEPIGGNPTPYTPVIEPGEGEEEDRNQLGGWSKRIYDALFSVTQIAGPHTVLRASYSLSYSTGYLTDPYKVISIVQPPDSADPGEPVEDIYENRPDSRTKHALYGQMKRYLHGASVDLAYRFFWDDWGVTSHTVDLYVRFDFKKFGATQPHIRLYHQLRADFSRPFLLQGEPLPDYASADSRLASFDAWTYGLNHSLPVSSRSRFNITVEWYSQRGDKSPPEAFGPLLAFDFFPKLDAVMLRLGLSHDF